MKHLFALVFLFFSLTSLQAQFSGMFGGGDMENPVNWTGEVVEKQDGSFDLVFHAKIKKGWHIFSQHTPDGGSLPLEVKYVAAGEDYQTNGETQESPTIRQYNDIFEVDEVIWENEATLTQNIQLKTDDTQLVKAELFYQVCEELCINEEYYFVFDLKNKAVEVYDDYDAFGAVGKTASKNTADSKKEVEGSSFSYTPSSMLMGGGGEESPVKWSGNVVKKGSDRYDLVFQAEIADGWHIFSQHTPDGGSLPMEITYHEEGKAYKNEGETQESPTIRQYNDIFEVDEVIWEETAELTQSITLHDTDIRYVKAEMFYQVCEELCINEEYYFVFDLEKGAASVFDNYDEFQAFGTGQETPDMAKTAVDKKSVTDSKDDRGMWVTFVLAFLWGFAALLTPCVFPMIPMTVSFFTKQSENKIVGKRNAILYSLFIIVIYVILGTLIVGIFGADSLNRLSTNVTFNLLFFLLLVVFAASFLGAFEIVLPSSWANKVDKRAGKGGIIGIFFMALALAIVSFSCTGPIIGTLLVQSASQGGIAPIIGMLGFSLALAIPFGLFALFPSWMNSLPKSGGWLNSVKVVLGLLELAFAFKFLSNADLVLQAHLLPRELFLAIWIAIFGVMAFYLFGKIQLPNDTKPEHISVGRLGLGMLALSFTIYLIPGIWGSPLKLISGFPPPMTYSESPYGVGYTKSQASFVPAEGMALESLPESAVPGPHDILAFRDYNEGMAYAKKIGKPVLLDFTGMACVNCRKMEERVWSESPILSILKRDVVLISLYVDVDEKLPENQQYTSKTTGRRIRTVGNKWSDFQIERYQMNAQPFYVLVSPEDESNLNEPVGYVPNAKKYEDWLKEGIGNFKGISSPEDISEI